jgi:hypothetical protein
MGLNIQVRTTADSRGRSNTPAQKMDQKNRVKFFETYVITRCFPIDPDLPHSEHDSLSRVDQIAVYSHLVCKEFSLQEPDLVNEFHYSRLSGFASLLPCEGGESKMSACV